MKRIISIFIAIVFIFAEIPVMNSIAAEGEIYINLSGENITDEQLAEMLVNGRIPADVTILNLWCNQISDLTPLSGLTNLRELDL